MVNLLIVSHSDKLSAGIKEFVEQVTRDAVEVAAVGGAADGTLGTSVDRIRSELERIAGPDGVLILVDLKGAAVAVETALDDLDHVRVVISNAPIVEGAYLAAIEASVGATLEETAAAALRAGEILKVQP